MSRLAGLGRETGYRNAESYPYREPLYIHEVAEVSPAVVSVGAAGARMSGLGCAAKPSRVDDQTNLHGILSPTKQQKQKQKPRLTKDAAAAWADPAGSQASRCEMPQRQPGPRLVSSDHEICRFGFFFLPDLFWPSEQMAFRPLYLSRSGVFRMPLMGGVATAGEWEGQGALFCGVSGRRTSV